MAREAFFGDRVLLQSTVTGKSSGLALNEHKLDMMQTVIRAKVYPDMTIENFKDMVWPHCKIALGWLCKTLRQKVKGKMDWSVGTSASIGLFTCQYPPLHQ